MNNNDDVDVLLITVDGGGDTCSASRSLKWASFSTTPYDPEVAILAQEHRQRNMIAVEPPVSWHSLRQT